MSEKVFMDEKTSLVWELKTFGNKRMEYTLEEAFEYAAELNSDKFGGYNDWRLPSIDELKSLCNIDPYDYKGDYTAWRGWYESKKEFLNGVFFILPELSDNVGKDGWYWSATAANKGEYYLFNFKEGNTNTHLLTQSFYVRCVRG